MVIDIIDLLSIKTIKDLQADFGAAHHSGEEVMAKPTVMGGQHIQANVHSGRS